MADEQVPDEPPSAQPPGEATPPEEEEEITRIHDKYFYRVFSDTSNAAGLLRPYLPPAVAGSLRWATLTHWPGRFVSDDWRGREADLVFSVEREETEEPVLVYVLLEHQSTPRYWMALRVLKYCLQILQKYLFSCAFVMAMACRRLWQIQRDDVAAVGC